LGGPIESSFVIGATSWPALRDGLWGAAHLGDHPGCDPSGAARGRAFSEPDGVRLSRTTDTLAVEPAPAATGPAVAPLVSVIVPHYDDLVGLDRCLFALERQTYPRDRFEIVVGDNNSPVGVEAVADVVQGRARLTVVTEKGAGPARNGALALSRHDVLAFTDSDCVPDPQWLVRGVAALNDFDLVGGDVVIFPADPNCVNAVEAFEMIFAFDNKSFVQEKGFSVTANLFTRRSIFESVGWFARSTLSEDVEWCRRAVSAGFRLGYRGDALVEHPARPTWGDVCKKTRRMEVEMFALKVDSTPSRLRWLLRLLAYPLSAIAHTPKVLSSPRLTTSRQKIGALFILYRIRLFRARVALGLLLSRRTA
jgi:cellulose synthase/poly-beta-1,6-N-acetylglucosamine synthase-like glycosyltransferase